MNLVRTAHEGDIPALAQLINAAYRVEAFFIRGDRTSEAEIRAQLADPRVAFLVIEGRSPGTLAGAVCSEVRGDRGYFGLLSVDPDRQGEGLARVLIDAAEAHCRAAGCTALDITVVNLRTELPLFYAKFGFRPVGTAPFPAPGKLRQPIHLVLMSKPLA
jgi:GNAT superfamily N-acetyltransferase